MSSPPLTTLADHLKGGFSTYRYFYKLTKTDRANPLVPRVFVAMLTLKTIEIHLPPTHWDTPNTFLGDGRLLSEIH